MTVRRLYTTRIPEAALQSEEPQAQNRLAQLPGTVASTPVVEDTGGQPNALRLRGQYRGTYGELLATELRELLAADAVDDLELYATSRETADAGYYGVESAQGGRFQPQTGAVAEFDARLVRSGTRADHRRAVKSGSPDSRQIDHDFGNETTGYVGVPATASQVRWLSFDKATLETASSDQTVAAEFGDVDLYDIEAAPSGVGDQPYLVYDLPYADAGDVDAAVFDTWGNPETDADGTFAWQAVYRADHVARGDLVTETGRVRTTLDPGSLSAERWDDGSSSWSSVSLGTSDWVLDDVDLVRPGAAHVYAQLTFRASADTTDASEGDLYPLDAFWHRGWDDVQFAIPESESGPIPSDLVDLLSPVASASVINPQPSRELIARKELRS